MLCFLVFCYTFRYVCMSFKIVRWNIFQLVKFSVCLFFVLGTCIADYYQENRKPNLLIMIFLFISIEVVYLEFSQNIFISFVTALIGIIWVVNIGKYISIKKNFKIIKLLGAYFMPIYLLRILIMVFLRFILNLIQIESIHVFVLLETLLGIMIPFYLFFGRSNRLKYLYQLK